MLLEKSVHLNIKTKQDMKTTVKQQKSILAAIKADIANGAGVKSIVAFVRGYGNPDNVCIDGTKVSVRVSHENNYFNLKEGY